MRRQFIWMQATLCAATFSVAAPVLAHADNGQPPPHAQAHGQDKDKNKNKNKDKNKDKDKQASNPRAWDPRFHGLDRNGNNVVSRTEWNGDDRSFANHDWNRDGMLSGDELRAGATRPTAARLPAPPPPAPKASGPRTDPDEAVFARHDVNRDGHLSRGEWVGSASEFNRLDFNKDGVLSAYEYGVGR
jgi:hypothetical protein